MPDFPRSLAAVVRQAAGTVALAACGALLVFNACVVSEWRPSHLSAQWRYWDDMALAAGRFLDERGLWPGEPRRTVPLGLAAGELREIVELQAAERRIEPWHFWRVVPARQFRRWASRGEPAPLEDPGRAALLSWGFRVCGGVSPYLLLWLALLCAAPIMVWCWLEFDAAGLSWAGTAFYALLATSVYCIESLTLPHSAFGFYLIACVMLAGFSAYAVSGRDRSGKGLFARLAACGVAFWLCAAARSGTLLLAPGFLLAIHWGIRRVLGLATASRRQRLAHTLVAFLVFLSPYLLLRPPQAHNVWLSLWEGLGDFARERGYSWYDVDAQAALRAAGIEPFRDPKAVTSEHERFFRQAVLHDVRQGPLWYSTVLVRRLVATVGLTHLLPWGPVDGQSLGTPRFHYKYTTPVDWFGVGSRSLEIPVQVFWLCGLGLVARALWRPRQPGAAEALRLVAPTAVGTLVLPVALTTAAGLETQAFALTYFLAFGLLCGRLLAKTSAFDSSSPASPAKSQAPGADSSK